MNSLFTSISDPVEKCREISLSLLKKSLELVVDVENTDKLLLETVQKLCGRINDVPFLETTEELRLQITDTLITLVKKHRAKVTADMARSILQMLSKGLTDSFPAVKRSCAELLVMVSGLFPQVAREHFKSILKVLLVNVAHQHSKTRILTLEAIGI